MRNRVQRWHVVGHDDWLRHCCSGMLTSSPHELAAWLCYRQRYSLIWNHSFCFRTSPQTPFSANSSAPLVHALFWQIAMRRAIPHPHNTSQRASFATRPSQVLPVLGKTHAPRALGQARGCSSAPPLDPQNARLPHARDSRFSRCSARVICLPGGRTDCSFTNDYARLRPLYPALERAAGRFH